MENRRGRRIVLTNLSFSLSIDKSCYFKQSSINEHSIMNVKHNERLPAKKAVSE